MGRFLQFLQFRNCSIVCTWPTIQRSEVESGSVRDRSTPAPRDQDPSIRIERGTESRAKADRFADFNGSGLHRWKFGKHCSSGSRKSS